MAYTKDDLPDPSDPKFFSKFHLTDDMLEMAFGAGAPLPRVTKRPPRPKATRPDVSAADDAEGSTSD